MRHVQAAIHRPIATVMIYIALAAIGLISSQLLPLEKWPDVEWPGIFVQVPYPGSTPQEIERNITRPLEESLATLSGVEDMRSWSTSNESRIWVQFKLGEEASAKGIDARARIDAARENLPEDVRDLFVFTGSLADEPVLLLRISSERDLSNSYDMLDRLLKRRIERIDGVSQVRLEGVDPREIRILLNPLRLAAHGIDARHIRNQLVRANFSISAGRITDNGRRFTIRPEGEFRSVEEFENFRIGDGDLRLADVATVELRTPERNYGRHLDQTYAIGLDIRKSTGANIVQVVDRIMEEVNAVKELPQFRDINIFTLQDQGDDIRDTLSDLIKSGMIGAILAICVLYLFLRQLSTTLIVTLSVPLSLLITLGALYFLGFSLNILSMMGMMLAVGMLVDNAVVVTENIFRRRQCEEGDPLAITSNAVSEVGLAVIAGTFTSISVFLPIIFGDKNQIAVFLTHVAIAITVAMLASLLIAQTLIPMLASRVKLPSASDKSAFMTRLADRYASILAVAIRRKWLMLLLTVLTLSSGVIAQKLVNVDMFPQESGRKLYLPYNLKAKYPLTVVENAVDKVEEYLYSNKEALNVAAVYTYFTEEEAQSMILLTPEEDATLSTKKIIAKIEEGLPEIIIGEPNFKFDQQGGNDGFSLQINGDSAEQLSVIAREVIQVISSVPGLKDVRLETAEQERELQVIIDRDQAARFGLSPLEIAGTIAVAMRGQNLREFRGDQGEVDVRLAFRDDDQETLENLASMQLRTADGNLIELSTVARFRFALGAQEISRVRRKTAAVIEANLEDSSLEEIRPLVTTAMSGYALPIGYSWKFGKGVEQANETEKQMGLNIVLAVVLIFFVMAAVFESVLYPLSIMISIGLSIVGVYWFFAVTGTTFSFMATIGILILIGVVVNNGIVLIDHVNNLRRSGIDRDAALVQAGRDRLRPILMTVATTILGLLPLAVGSTQVGGDGPPYFPMARAIIGGLAFSTIASLFIVPYVYVVVDSMAKWTRKVGRIARNPTLAR